MHWFPDHRRRRLGEKGNLGESGLPRGLLESAKRRAGENYWMAKHQRAHVPACRRIGLALQPSKHDADQRPDAEIGGP